MSAQPPTELTSYEVDLASYEVEVITGQIVLFEMPVVEKPSEERRASPQIGNAGESLVAAIFESARPPIPYIRQPHWYPDSDFLANGWRLQVKATESIARDGRLRFHAGGSKRFASFAGKVDRFAFIFVNIESELFARMRILPADEVFRVWPGSIVYLHPSDLLRVHDLSLLREQKP